MMICDYMLVDLIYTITHCTPTPFGASQTTATFTSCGYFSAIWRSISEAKSYQAYQAKHGDKIKCHPHVQIVIQALSVGKHSDYKVKSGCTNIFCENSIVLKGKGVLKVNTKFATW